MTYILLAALAAQMGPRIGIIDYYGAKAVSNEKLRHTLKVAEGDPLPASKAALEETLVAMKGITRANVEAVCCDAGKAIFYIGVEERGRPHLDIREEPKNLNLLMPDDVAGIYNKLLDAGPDPSAVEAQLPDIAENHQAILRQILREGADPEDRRAAATVLGYGPRAQSIIEDLQLGLRDPDQEVRAAAFKSLAPLAVYARKHPEAEIRVLTTWFVEMLNSVSWKDRVSAMKLLVELTDERDEKLMRHLKERGIPALIEMSLWKHLPHALPAYILLGRIADLSEQEIQDSWSANQREETVKKMRKKLKA